MPRRENERCESQEADAQRHEHQVAQAEQVLWKPFAVRPAPEHGHDPAETRKGSADAGEAEKDVQDMLVHGSDSARFVRGMGAIPEKSCVRQRTELWTAADHTAAMPQFSIPNSHSRETFLSPRKNLLAVGVVLALSAIALLTGRTPAPTPAPDAESPTELHATPALNSTTPHQR